MDTIRKEVWKQLILNKIFRINWDGSGSLVDDSCLSLVEMSETGLKHFDTGCWLFLLL
jgi:hypothetical protein